mgnify:CR=1 FL=1
MARRKKKRLDDFGEKIGGARKDVYLKPFRKKEAYRSLMTYSSVFSFTQVPAGGLLD